jgi:hypothetical protein
MGSSNAIEWLVADFIDNEQLSAVSGHALEVPARSFGRAELCKEIAGSREVDEFAGSDRSVAECYA